MRRFTGACVVACAGTAAFTGCDLDLPPFVEPVDAGVTPTVDATPDVTTPVQDARVEEDAAIVDAGTDAGDAAPTKKRVFVTSATTNGALGANGPAALVAADARCQAAAVAGNLPGTFVAWLSIQTPATPAISRIVKDVGPWYLPGTDGKQVFATKAAITTTGPEVPINVDEKGVAAVAPLLAWTGTQNNGQVGGQNCQSYTSAVAIQQGLAGQLAEKNANWTQGNNQSCQTPLHLYCFEQ